MDPQLVDGAAGKLKLKNHPPTSELVTLLERFPPGDEAIARQWFEVLSGRVPGTVLHFYPSEAIIVFSLLRRFFSS